VFAFFGRSVSPADETDTDMWLSYDTKLNKIRFEDSTCDFNRNVYTTLVLASLVLLMFFIAVQVVAETEVSSAAPVVSVAVPVATVSREENADAKQARNASASAHLVFKHLTPAPRLRFSAPC
jgi:hypothetical protein